MVDKPVSTGLTAASGTRSAASLAGARIYAQAAQFIIFVFAARFLGPEEFGLYALVFLLVGLCVQVVRSGWSEYALTHDAERDAALAMSWIGGLSAGLLLALAGLSAVLLTEWDPQIGVLCMLFGLFVPLAAFGSMQGACFISRGEVKRLAIMQILSETVAFAVTIGTLWAGYGLLSLAFGKIAQELFGATFGVFFTRWWVGRLPLRSKLKGMLVFTAHIMGARVVAFAQNNLATLLIGIFLGPGPTGLYRAGARFTGALSEVIVEPMRPLFWISGRAARNADDPKAEMRHATHGLLTVGLSLGAVLFTGLALIAPALVHLLLGEEWMAAVPVLMLLCVRRFLTLHAPALEPALALTGNLRLIPRLAVASAIASLGMLVIFAPWGLNWAAAGQVLSGVVPAYLICRYLNASIGLTLGMTFSALLPALASSGIMVLAVLGADRMLADISFGLASGPIREGARMLVGIMIGALTFPLALLTFSRSTRRLIRTYWKGRSAAP